MSLELIQDFESTLPALAEQFSLTINQVQTILSQKPEILPEEAPGAKTLEQKATFLAACISIPVSIIITIWAARETPKINAEGTKENFLRNNPFC